nr:hypothetical protein CFP56_65166 [Quercus suber]
MDVDQYAVHRFWKPIGKECEQPAVFAILQDGEIKILRASARRMNAPAVVEATSRTPLKSLLCALEQEEKASQPGTWQMPPALAFPGPDGSSLEIIYEKAAGRGHDGLDRKQCATSPKFIDDSMAWPSVYGLEARNFRSSPSAPSPKPTIVLIHDAFHLPEHLEALNVGLVNCGFRVVLPRLPSSGPAPPPNALEADAQAICRAARPDLESGRDLIVITHGYSSIRKRASPSPLPALPIRQHPHETTAAGSIAAERLNEFSLQRPRAGHVIRLLFFAGIIVSRGESLDTVFRADWMRAEGHVLRVSRPVPVFYQDCTSTVARSAAARLVPQAASSFQTRVPSPGWAQVQCLYVVLEASNAVPLAFQQHFAQKLRSANRCTAVTTMQTGHSPFLSNVPETVALIVAAANQT